MRVRMRVQPLVVELELVQGRIVDSHLDLGRQPEIDLEPVEQGHQVRLRLQERGLDALILVLRKLSRARALFGSGKLGLVQM